MTQFYPIVFEREDDGAVSAYVAGLPVYAQSRTRATTERLIKETLAAYLEEHPEARPLAAIKVAKVTSASGKAAARTQAPNVIVVSPAAMMGARTSAKKAVSSRANGRLGGRPRKGAAR